MVKAKAKAESSICMASFVADDDDEEMGTFQFGVLFVTIPTIKFNILNPYSSGNTKSKSGSSQEK